MTAPPPPENNISPLVDSLAAGFEALLSTLQLQTETEKALRARLDFAANEVSVPFSLPPLSI